MSAVRAYNFQALLRHDFEELLVRYMNDFKADCSFGCFVSVWNELKFDSLFAIRKFALNSYRFLLRDAFSVLKEFLSPEFKYEWRLGAVYVYYGMYAFENKLPQQKMRLTIDDWNSLKSFLDLVRFRKDRQAEFVIKTLLVNNAFHHTAANTVYSYRELSRTGENLILPPCPTDFLATQQISKDLLTTSDSIEPIRQIHHSYVQQKIALLNDCNTLKDVRIIGLENDKFNEILKISEHAKSVDVDALVLPDPQTEGKCGQSLRKSRKQDVLSKYFSEFDESRDRSPPNDPAAAGDINYKEPSKKGRRLHAAKTRKFC